MVLTKYLTNITEHQLKQAIYYESALRYGQLLGIHPGAEEDFKKATTGFTRYAKITDSEFLEMEAIIEKILKEGLNAKSEASLQAFNTKILALDKEHRDYEHHAEESLDLMRQGDLKAALSMAHDIEKEQETLNQHLEDALALLLEETEAALHTVEQHEFSIIWMIIGALLTSTVLSILFVAFIEKEIERSIRKTMNAVTRLSAGDFSSDIEIEGKDELNQINQALNKLTQTQREVLGDVQMACVSLSKGDLKKRVDTECQGLFNELKSDVNNTIEQLMRSMNEIGNMTKSAANGDFTANTSLEGKEGFYKELTQNLNTFMNTSNNSLDDILRVLNAIAAGNLDEKITREYQGIIGVRDFHAKLFHLMSHID